MRLLILLWHPSPLGAVGGGFRICEELLKRKPNYIKVDVVDTFPTFLSNIKDISCHEYRIPKFIKILEKWNFAFERALEWLYACVSIAYLTLKLIRRKYDVIYVPISELTFTAFPIIILKILGFFRSRYTKVVIGVMNVGRSGSLRTSYRYFRKMGLSIIASIVGSLYVTINTRLIVLMANRSDKVVTLSVYLKNLLHQHGVKKKIIVMPVGIDFKFINKFPKQRKIYDGIFIGRCTPEKGVFDLISVWKIVTSKFPDAKLAIIGPFTINTYRILIQQIRDQNLMENIIIIGPISEYKEIIRNLKSSNFVVFLSVAETWGLVPIEGLACGLPVIVYDLPVYKENIRDCEATFLVSIGDYQEVADKIINILNMPKVELYRLNQKARNFSNRFDWGILADRAFKILME